MGLAQTGTTQIFLVCGACRRLKHDEVALRVEWFQKRVLAEAPLVIAEAHQDERFTCVGLSVRERDGWEVGAGRFIQEDDSEIRMARLGTSRLSTRDFELGMRPNRAAVDFA
nr:hypothetical protein [Hyalangium gracile]